MSEAEQDKKFLETAVDLEFISQEDAQKALEEQKIDSALSQEKRIAHYLFEKGIINREQISNVLKMIEKFESAEVPKQVLTQAELRSPHIYNPESLPSWAVADHPTTYKNRKSRSAYVILAILFGGLGIHNFFAGHNNRGMMQLAVLALVYVSYMLGSESMLTVTSLAILIWIIVDILTVTKDAKGVNFS